MKQWDISNCYKTLEEEFRNPDKWENCPNCNQKPRLWVFNNGNYAKCQCDTMYGEPSAIGINVVDWGREHDWDFTNYNGNEDLRLNWNKCIQIRKRKITIYKLLDNGK